MDDAAIPAQKEAYEDRYPFTGADADAGAPSGAPSLSPSRSPTLSPSQVYRHPERRRKFYTLTNVCLNNLVLGRHKKVKTTFYTNSSHGFIKHNAHMPRSVRLWTTVQNTTASTMAAMSKGVYYDKRTLFVKPEWHPQHCKHDVLFALADYLVEHENTDYHAPGTTDWCTTAFEMLGLSKGKRVHAACYRELVVPHYMQHRVAFANSELLKTERRKHNQYLSPYNISDETFGFLLARAQNTQCTEPQTDQVLIYSRNDVPKRRWMNIDAFEERLRPHQNVVRYDTLNNLTLCQQIGLFSRSRAIISPHGGHLGNLLWTHPGTRVIEFFCRLKEVAGWTSSFIRPEYYRFVQVDLKALPVFVGGKLVRGSNRTRLCRTGGEEAKGADVWPSVARIMKAATELGIGEKKKKKKKDAQQRSESVGIGKLDRDESTLDWLADGGV